MAARSLSDHPRPGETIIMNMSANGAMVGNNWDITPHLNFSTTTDNFTLDTYNKYRRTITVTMEGAHSLPFRFRFMNPKHLNPAALRH